MRVTGGTLRGRTILAPKTIRPTSERVREALFSSLGDAVVGARVLDLFAGSGALGLEAWSRGAAEVTWVENNAKVFRILERNVRALCPDSRGRAIFIRRSAYRYIEESAAAPFDIILADPPYAKGGAPGSADLLLRALENGPILQAAGQFVMEQTAREPVDERPGWRLSRDKTYGDTRLVAWTPMYNSGQVRVPPRDGDDTK